MTKRLIFRLPFWPEPQMHHVQPLFQLNWSNIMKVYFCWLFCREIPHVMSILRSAPFFHIVDFGWIQTLFLWILKSFDFGISIISSDLNPNNTGCMGYDRHEEWRWLTRSHRLDLWIQKGSAHHEPSPLNSLQKYSKNCSVKNQANLRIHTPYGNFTLKSDFFET